MATRAGIGTWRTAIVAIALVSALGLFEFTSPSGINQSGASTTTTGDISSSGECQVRIPLDPVPNLSNDSGSAVAHILPNGTLRLLVLVMTPGSTATICVRYSAWPGDSNKTIPASVEVVNATQLSSPGPETPYGTYPGYEYSYEVAPNITVDSNVTAISSPASTFTIAYTISASSFSTGFYDFHWPYESSLLPLAVVDNAQTINASDFRGFFAEIQAGSGNAVGFNGMNAYWMGSNTESLDTTLTTSVSE